jgi:hypothetical protein
VAAVIGAALALWIRATALWIGAAEAAPCEPPATAAALVAAVGAAEAGWSQMDADAFAAGAGEVRQALECMGEEVSATELAAAMRTLGLEAFREGSAGAAEAWFGAARTLEPDYTFPDALLRPGHPAREAYLAAEAPAGDRALPAPASGWLQIDGRRSVRVPTDRPYYFQRFDGAGAVTQSAVVEAGGSPPPYPIEDYRQVYTEAVKDIGATSQLAPRALSFAPLAMVLPSLAVQLERTVSPRWALGLRANVLPSTVTVYDFSFIDQLDTFGYNGDGHMAARGGAQARLFYRERLQRGGTGWRRGYLRLALDLQWASAYDTRHSDGSCSYYGLFCYEPPPERSAIDEDAFDRIVWVESAWGLRPVVGLGREWIWPSGFSISAGWDFLAYVPLSASYSFEGTSDDKSLSEEGALAEPSILWPFDSRNLPPSLELRWRF